MIQDIFPSRLSIEYKHELPDPDSIVLCFDKQTILIKSDDEKIYYPHFCDFFNYDTKCFTYLFKLDEVKCFLFNCEALPDINGFKFESVNVLRKGPTKAYSFAGITAYQLYKWYSSNIFCGACAGKLSHSDTERMLYCEACKQAVYPKISPVVIVAVYNGDKLLMTRYSGRPYVNYSLIAGFIEIGESPEDAAHREVLEEAGVRIKNLRYYKSQPWGYSDTLLLGYTAELDGDNTITLDESELSEASWIARDDITTVPDDVSLTNEMICRFKSHDF